MFAAKVSENPNESRNTVEAASMLDCLPLELIKKVFLYSLNVSLLHMYPFLANERVYRLLILLAFWDNDYEYDKSYNTSKDRDVFGGDPARFGGISEYTWKMNKTFNIPWLLRPLGYDYVPLTSREKGELQSSILQCEWCTTERIRKLLPDLARLVFSRWCSNAGYIYIFATEEEILQFKRLLHSEKEDEELYSFCLIKGSENPAKRQQTMSNEDEMEDGQPRCQMNFKVGEFLELESVTTVMSEGIHRFFPLLSMRMSAK